jgi:hypothetical protein
MSDAASPTPATPKSEVAPAQVISPEVAKEVLEKKLEEAPAEKLISLLFASITRTTTIGPDPETAKTMAQAEMHAETSKLEAYKEQLKTRDEQNKRDHDYRCKKLGQNGLNLRIVLVVAVCGCIGGIVLLLGGHQLVGSNVLIACALTVYHVIGGHSPFTSHE